MEDLWKDDLIQFARLLCEIRANISATNRDWRALSESMDLSMEQLEVLFDRADLVWETAKENNANTQNL